MIEYNETIEKFKHTLIFIEALNLRIKAYTEINNSHELNKASLTLSYKKNDARKLKYKIIRDGYNIHEVLQLIGFLNHEDEFIKKNKYIAELKLKLKSQEKLSKDQINSKEIIKSRLTIHIKKIEHERKAFRDLILRASEVDGCNFITEWLDEVQKSFDNIKKQTIINE